MGLSIVGLGPGDGRYLSSEGRELLSRADVVGAEGRYAGIAARYAPKAGFLAFDGDVDAFAAAIAHEGLHQETVVLASGDPLLYSLGAAVLERLPAGSPRVIPAVSSFQVLCSLIGVREDDVQLISLHAFNPGDPDGIRNAERRLAELDPRRPVAVYLRPGFDAAWAAERLGPVRGWDCEAWLGVELGTASQELVAGRLADIRGLLRSGRSTLFVRAARPARCDDDGPIAVVAASFGTSVARSVERCVAPCEEALRGCRDGLVVVRAFTSERVRSIWRSRGVSVPNVGEALAQLSLEGYRRVIVQPLHIIPGEEYHKIMIQAAACRSAFDALRVAQPFLGSSEAFDDAVAVIDRLYPPRGAGEAVVLMGHGSDHPANGLYSMLDAKLADLGPGRIVANVEGYPGIGRAIARLKAGGVKRVVLAPLMLVAGVHVRDDMAGDGEDSWVRVLSRAGIEAAPLLRGLGQQEAAREVFTSRLRRELNELGRFPVPKHTASLEASFQGDGEAS